jgi:hypothetical protein
MFSHAEMPFRHYCNKSTSLTLLGMIGLQEEEEKSRKNRLNFFATFS